MRGLGKPDDINEVLLRLYRLAQDSPLDEFQDEALNLIKQVLPFDSSMWGTATAQASGIDVHTIHLHNSDPQMMVEYNDVKHMDHAAATVFGKERITSGFNAREWFAPKSLTPMRDYCTDFGHENVFITAASNPVTNFVHWISLFRAGEDDFCTLEEQELLRSLSPHVMQALGFNRVVHLGKSGAPSAPADRQGNAIADLRGVIYHSDELFERHAQAEWSDWKGMGLPDRLKASMLNSQGRLVGQRTVLHWKVDQRLLFLRSRPRCKADSLTDREALVARLVGKGETHKEVAKSLCTAPATVRNQIQSIYNKLGVSSIAHLIEELRLAT